ncbi:anaerobic ribonucleoside-triphosphate reductase activating protein [Candidatus Bathyarchaeota archaeon]|nr:MAG: anaerobic ribonucleoside-triphosphate reductase activating protein [Candidatus Bathyarchaeota archaeon]
MRIGGFVDMSTIDWYGNVSLVVFFAGCNFRCPYCQNSSLLPLDSGREVEAEYVRRRMEVGRDLLDSIVITGGEPLLQPEGLEEVAGLARALGLKVMLNTNGSRSEVVERLLEAGLIDRVALDVKAPFTEEEYSSVVGEKGGALCREVEKTLEICREIGVEIEVRTTVAPGVSDGPEFIERIATSIKGKCDEYSLQQFDNLGDVLSPELKAKSPPSRERMMELAEVALASGLENVSIKTREMGLERMS